MWKIGKKRKGEITPHRMSLSPDLQQRNAKIKTKKTKKNTCFHAHIHTYRREKKTA